MKISEIFLFESDVNYLQQQYNHYNQMLFDGQLPKIPIFQKVMKGKGGKVKGKLVKSNRPPPNRIKVMLGHEDKLSNYDIVDMTMTISSTYKRSDHQLDAILIHEMIHVYFFVIGRISESHGTLFLQQVARCSKIVGFEIPVTDDTDNLEFNDNVVKQKTVGVVLIEKGSETIISLIGANYILSPDTQEALKRMLGYRVKINKQAVTFYTISDEIWSKKAMEYPIQRVGRTLKMYRFSDQNAIDDLKKNGTVVGRIT